MLKTETESISLSLTNIALFMFSVLYIDDDSALLDIGKIYLERLGKFTVDIVPSAYDALNLITSKDYDAIISDYEMPRMDGIDLLKKVRDSGNTIPFILFTGRGREEIVIQALNEGADFYIQKGGDPKPQFTELSHKVTQAIQKRIAERALAESEERYRDVVETQTEFISRYLPDSTHVFVNEAYCRHFGKQRDQIIGHRFTPSIPKEDREMVRLHYQALTPEHPSAVIEHRVLMPDGTIRWHWWRDIAIFDREGRVVEYQSMGKDITDRKEAQEALYRSENLYRALFDYTVAATCIIGPDTIIRKVNAAWEKLCGYSREEAENSLSWTQFIQKDDLEQLKQYHVLRRIDPTEAPRVYECRVVDRKGAVHNCIAYVDIIPDTRDSVASLFDITDRKKAEETIRESEERFRAVVEDQTELICRFTPDGRLTFVNDAYCRYFNLDKNQCLLRPHCATLPPEDLILMKQHLSSLSRDNPVALIEHRIVMPDKTIRWQRWNDRAIFGENGRIVEFQSVGRDVTEHKLAEEALRESEKRYRELFSSITDAVFVHELAGPKIGSGNFIEVNPGACQMLGYTRDELLHLAPEDLIAPESDVDVTKMKENLNRKEDVSVELLLVTKDTTRIPVEIHSHVSMMGEKKLVISLAHDISGRKQADAALRESEERFRLIFNSSTDAMLVHRFMTEKDPWQIIEVNDTMCRQYGYSRNELLRMRPQDFDADEGRAVTEHDIVNRLLTEGHAMWEGTHITKDGVTFPVEIDNTVFEQNGETMILASARDITRRRQVEDALQESGQQFRNFFNESGDAITIHDMQGRFLEVNTEICQRLGYSADELLKMSPCDIDDPEYGHRVADRIQELRKKGHIIFETVHLAKDKTRIPTEVSSRIISYRGEPAVISTARDITRRKQVETALRESEEKFRRITEQSGDLIAITDCDGIIRYASPASRTLFYMEPDEMYGRNFSEFLDESAMPVAITAFREALENQKPARSLLLKMKRKDGSLFVGELNGSEYSYHSNRGSLVVIRDVTERIKAEEAVKERESALKNAQRIAHLGSWVMDLKSGRISWSDELFRIIGYEPQSFIPQYDSLDNVIHPEDLEPMRGAVAQSIVERTPFECVLRVIRPDGTIRVLLDQAEVFYDESGCPVRMIGTALDVTLQKQMETSLREERWRLQSVIEGTRAATWEWNIQTGEMVINEKWAEMIGFTPDELSPISIRTWEELTHPDDLAQSEILLQRHFSGEIPYYECECRMKHKDGHWIWVLDRGQVITRTPDGKPLMMFGTHIEITSRKKAEYALLLANQQLSLMTSITRHDIINQVMIILAYIEMMREEPLDPDLEAFLQKIRSATEIIQSQIEFTRVYQNLGRHEPQWLQPEKCISLLQVPAQITLTADLHGLEVYADPMLEKVFFNLFDNSVRHGESLTKIQVSAVCTNNGLTIVWEDNGTGVAHKDKERIFERGFGKNSGLGLFLIREVLSLTGMKITETGIPGAGARFEIFVPKGGYRFINQVLQTP